MSKGDEPLKAISVMGLIRSDARSQIKEELDRALARNPWWKRHLAEAAVKAAPKAVTYGANTAVGYQIPLAPELSEALDSTIRRIAIGLLFRANPQWDATKHSFEVVQAREEAPVEFVGWLRTLGPLPHHISLGHQVFFAAWGFAKDSLDHGVMIVSLFGGLHFAVFITPKGFQWGSASMRVIPEG